MVEIISSNPQPPRSEEERAEARVAEERKLAAGYVALFKEAISSLGTLLEPAKQVSEEETASHEPAETTP